MTAALGQEETRDRDYFRLDSKGGQRRGAPCPRGINRPWRKIGWWARFALPTLRLLPTLELHPAFDKILWRKILRGEILRGRSALLDAHEIGICSFKCSEVID